MGDFRLQDKEFCYGVFIAALEESMRAYDRSRPLKTWDSIQNAYGCCGVNNYTDWKSIVAQGIPDSCCKRLSYDCGRYYNLENINQNGCLPDLANYVNDLVRYGTTNFQTFCVIMGILSLLFGMMLMYHSFKQFCVCKISASFYEDEQHNFIENVNYDNGEVETARNNVGNDIEDSTAYVHAAGNVNAFIHAENRFEDQSFAEESAANHYGSINVT